MEKPKLKDILFKLELWFSEGLVAVSILFLVIITVFFGYVKIRQLTNIAKILPVEETYAFAIVSSPDYLETSAKFPEESPLSQKSILTSFTGFLGNNPEDLDWVGRDAGMAFVDEELVYFVRVRSKTKALKYFEGLVAEGEELAITKFEGSKIYSYPLSFPTKFAFYGNVLAISFSEEPLKLMADVKAGNSPSLRDDDNYSNVRSRLPYFSSGFIYSNLPQSRVYVAQIFAKLGISEPGYLEPIFQLFPAFGATIRMEEDAWYMETYTAVDKSRLDNEGLFRYDTKYEHKFLSYLDKEYLFMWGGHSVRAQVFRMIDLLKNLHSSASLVFESSIQASAEKYFGDGTNLEEEVYPLLDGEYLFAWNPVEPKSFSFILGFDAEESSLAYRLKDLLVLNFKYSMEYAREIEINGEKMHETGAELVTITQEEKKYEGHLYYILKTDLPLAAISISDTYLVITDNEESLLSTLDIIDGRKEGSSLNQISSILSGSDEISLLNLELLSDDNSLKKILNGFQSVATTRKVFDDGIFTRHSLQFK